MLKLTSAVLIVLSMWVSGCATAPKTGQERAQLHQRALETLQEAMQRDPSMRGVLEQAEGYAVFPSIGKGGAGVGGAFGRGVLFDRGQMVGYVDVSQASIGLQLGGQSFSEILVFRSRSALENLKGGQFSLGANVSGVAITTGAAASTNFERGVAAFIIPRGGLMAELSLSGQRINFVPSA